MSEEIQNLNEPVTITRGQLQGILSELENLKKGPRFEKPKRVTEHTATLRFEDEKPVIGYSNVRDKKDENGKLVAWMDIKLQGEDGKEEIKTVEYLAFLNSPNSVQVRIKSQELKESRRIEGTRQADNPDPVHNKKWEPHQIELEVVTRKYAVTVEVLEGLHKGKAFIVPSDALNS